MKVISFRVEDGQAEEIAEYARRKGYGRPCGLARVALFQHMARYPLAGARGYRWRMEDDPRPEARQGAVAPAGGTAGASGGGCG